MRRLSTVGATLVALAVMVGLATAAGGAPSAQAEPSARGLDVLKVSGLLDPVLVDFVDSSISTAEAKGDTWVVLQLDSPGAVVPDERLARLVEHVRTATVPIAVWVGPSGAKALRGAAQLAAVADEVGVSPGSSIGRLGDPVIDPSRFQPPFRAAVDRLHDRQVGAASARDLQLTTRPAPVIGDFVIGLAGVQTRVVQTKDGPRRAVDEASRPVFRALPVGDQLMHTVASPSVAYLLFVVGMALIVFELFTAGVGVAGLVGAGAFVLASYGLTILPARPWAVGLLVASMVAFAVDVQTGVPRVWTALGGVAFVAGSFLLYEGVSLSWVTLLFIIPGVFLFMLAGMPAMVRTRFSTPTIGREWMVGEAGEAVADVAPDGVVRVRGALWRARTNRATPVDAGSPVRVVEVDGLLLEVEPLEGAARDHRRR